MYVFVLYCGTTFFDYGEMMRKYRNLFLLTSLLLTACMTSEVQVPEDFKYQEVPTKNFLIASWKKYKNPNSDFKVYIEGDGASFDAYGRPTGDPTPRGDFMRNLAFSDPSPNVIYLARPCQFVDDFSCNQRFWTGARFSPFVIESECEAIAALTSKPVTLIGYSGGGMVAGLLSLFCPVVPTKKVITIAGNLDHLTWTRMERLTPLNESMNLADYKDQFAKVPQHHYVGSKDTVVPYNITMQTIPERSNVTLVTGATHNKGWEEIYPEIHKLK